MFQNAMLRILVLMGFMIALVGADCTKIISDGETGKGRSMTGSYTRVKDPENDEIVKDIVSQGVKEYNLRSNTLLQFVKKGEILKAFSQLVNGQNFCVQFQVSSSGCKNNINSEFCQGKEEHTCVVSAFKAFADKTATITKSSLSCD